MFNFVLFSVCVMFMPITRGYLRVLDINHCNHPNLLLTADNIHTLKNCTHFEGRIRISNATFTNMHKINLDFLSSIKSIKGSIIMDAFHPQFTDLLFLKNLEYITSLYSATHFCVVIKDTSLKSIDLPKLKEIACIIMIKNNKALCSADKWTKGNLITKAYLSRIIESSNGNDCTIMRYERKIQIGCKVNEYEINDECRRCNDQCKDGCKGSGSDQCRSCENLKDEQNCVANCPKDKYIHDKECKQCNDQCKGGCKGPGSDQCFFCKNLKDGQNCVEICPEDKYNFNNKCWENIHPKYDDIHNCSENEFFYNNECLMCHINCVDGCTGFKSTYGEGGCNFCDKIIQTDDQIECLHLDDPCPRGYFDTIVPFETELNLLIFRGKIICLKQKNGLKATIGIILTAILVIILLSVVLIYFICKKKIYRNYRKTGNAKIEKNEDESLLSRLLLIKKSDIRLGKLLGQGNFGAVYEAVYKPVGSDVGTTVAVKILHSNPSAYSFKDFLAEAAIMAELDHPHIIKLIGVCMAKEIMILTILMRSDCLLTYIRNNKNRIPPKTLLNWSTQIAKGMVYLEKKQLVHRDLAARNILLETEDCVRITDFGLSKFLRSNESDSDKIKLPIKNLAPECLWNREFTHKSDVWAYGITIWELLTFGERPFVDIQGSQIITQLQDHLNDGVRLPQPPICKANLFASLLQCWMFDPKHRPDFQELESTFSKMTDNPSNYIYCFGTTKVKQTPQLPVNIIVTTNRQTNRSLSSTCPPKVLIKNTHHIKYYDQEHYLKPKVPIANKIC